MRTSRLTNQCGQWDEDIFVVVIVVSSGLIYQITDAFLFLILVYIYGVPADSGLHKNE